MSPTTSSSDVGLFVPIPTYPDVVALLLNMVNAEMDVVACDVADDVDM